MCSAFPFQTATQRFDSDRMYELRPNSFYLPRLATIATLLVMAAGTALPAQSSSGSQVGNERETGAAKIEIASLPLLPQAPKQGPPAARSAQGTQEATDGAAKIDWSLELWEVPPPPPTNSQLAGSVTPAAAGSETRQPRATGTNPNAAYPNQFPAGTPGTASESRQLPALSGEIAAEQQAQPNSANLIVTQQPVLPAQSSPSSSPTSELGGAEFTGVQQEPAVAPDEPDPQPDWMAPSELPESAPYHPQGLPSLAAPVQIRPAPPQQQVNEQWWTAQATAPLSAAESIAISPDRVVIWALQNSPKLRAISREPLIREAAIGDAQSRFDPELFVETQFDDTNDAVGNQLTVGGGLDRLKDNIWYSETGFRKKLYTGADVDVSQRLQFQNSNSTFFLPQDQGTATLSFNVSQPLLRGRGRMVNRSQIVLAEISSGVAWQQYVTELQTEVEAIVNAYWDLYLRRSVYLQKLKNVERGQKILEILENRLELDSTPSQIARARAAVALRKTELSNSIRDVRNTESELLRRIGTLQARDSIELVPAEPPRFNYQPNSISDMAAVALSSRPEIQEAFARAKAATVQAGVSRNELLPDLKMLFGVYFDALEGDTGLVRALQRQYSETTPGYYAGLQFNYQLGNRAARSQLNQVQLQLARVRDEIQEISQQVIFDSQVAVRRLDSAFETLRSTALAIDAAAKDLEQQQRRWEVFALVEGDLVDGANPTTMLDQLLDAQQRLTAAELTFSQAEFEFKSAEIGLRKANGTLLQQQEIELEKYYSCDGDSGIQAIKNGQRETSVPFADR